MPVPGSVKEYMASASPSESAAFEQIRRVVLDMLPDVDETISYGMPTFKHKGKAILGFAFFKNHSSLFPYSKSVMRTLEKELEPFDTASKGATIRFSPDDPLPTSLLRKLVKVRVDEIEDELKAKARKRGR